MKTQKTAGVIMELLTRLTYKFLMGLCGSVVLPGKLGPSIVERFTCREAIIKTFKSFHLKKLYSIYFIIL